LGEIGKSGLAAQLGNVVWSNAHNMRRVIYKSDFSLTAISFEIIMRDMKQVLVTDDGFLISVILISKNEVIGRLANGVVVAYPIDEVGACSPVKMAPSHTSTGAQ